MSTESHSDAPRQKPLISRSSILILGGVLIGLSCSEGFNHGFGSTTFFGFVAALVGLFAFIALDFVGRQRRARAEYQQAITKLEQRVSRHLSEEC
jgi:hypothetical protein